MTEYRLVAEPPADLDVAATHEWYENEQPGLGLEFLDELRATYDRIVDGPFKYEDLASPTPCTSRWKLMWSSCSRSST